MTVDLDLEIFACRILDIRGAKSRNGCDLARVQFRIRKKNTSICHQSDRDRQGSVGQQPNFRLGQGGRRGDFESRNRSRIQNVRWFALLTGQRTCDQHCRNCHAGKCGGGNQWATEGRSGPANVTGLYWLFHDGRRFAGKMLLQPPVRTIQVADPGLCSRLEQGIANETIGTPFIDEFAPGLVDESHRRVWVEFEDTITPFYFSPIWKIVHVRQGDWKYVPVGVRFRTATSLVQTQETVFTTNRGFADLTG
jgi:hypothetical protein